MKPNDCVTFWSIFINGDPWVHFRDREAAARFMLNHGDDADEWVCIERIFYFADALDWRAVDKVVTEEEGEIFDVDDLHFGIFKRTLTDVTREDKDHD